MLSFKQYNNFMMVFNKIEIKYYNIILQQYNINYKYPKSLRL